MSGLRLALSMFTIFPVAPHGGDVSPDGDAPDRGTCAAAIRWFPVVGVLLAVLAQAVTLLFWRTGFRTDEFVSGCGSPTLAGVSVVAVFAVLTRGLHLDGLADVADGLGSGKPADQALSIMKRSDIGPFGVLSVVLVVVAQVGALAYVFASGDLQMNLAILVTAAVTGRLAALHACSTTIPAARPGGFGSLVAGTATRSSLVRVDLLSLAGVVLLCLFADFGSRGISAVLTACVVGLFVGQVLVRKCVRRFGGVTGDVFGAVVESSTTAALLAVAAFRTFGVLS